MDEPARIASTQVRAAGPEDVEACARVHVRSWQVAYRGIVPDAYLDSLTPEDRLDAWEQWLAQPHERGCVLVAEVSDQVVGFGSFVAHDSLGPEWALIPNLYLLPDAIGRGHGRRLMEAGMNTLATFGYRLAELWVHPDNRRAQRFYRMGGWAPDGTARTHTVWGIELDSLRYVRTVGPADH